MGTLIFLLLAMLQLSFVCLLCTLHLFLAVLSEAGTVSISRRVELFYVRFTSHGRVQVVCLRDIEKPIVIVIYVFGSSVSG